MCPDPLGLLTPHRSPDPEENPDDEDSLPSYVSWFLCGEPCFLCPRGPSPHSVEVQRFRKGSRNSSVSVIEIESSHSSFLGTSLEQRVPNLRSFYGSLGTV